MIPKALLRVAPAALVVVALTACSPDGLVPGDPAGSQLPALSLSKTAAVPSAADEADAALYRLMQVANAGLAGGGANYRVEVAEWLASPEAEEAGRTVFFLNRGNKQLGHHFVPGDPRRGGGTDITYTVDQTQGAVDALSQAQTNAAIGRAMDTWEGVNCAAIPVRAVDNPGTDLGRVQYLVGQGGDPDWYADITHAGWLPAGAFGLPANVIAVTFTFIWVDGGVPTDIDGNGKLDTALREIYYLDGFTWQDGANIDVETIALHEAGHGLSQGHFGTAFRTLSNLKLHFAPRAVMNAAYSGIQTAIAQTDNAGHCSIWAHWPNN